MEELDPRIRAMVHRGLLISLRGYPPRSDREQRCLAIFEAYERGELRGAVTLKQAAKIAAGTAVLPHWARLARGRPDAGRWAGAGG